MSCLHVSKFARVSNPRRTTHAVQQKYPPFLLFWTTKRRIGDILERIVGALLEYWFQHGKINKYGGAGVSLCVHWPLALATSTNSGVVRRTSPPSPMGPPGTQHRAWRAWPGPTSQRTSFPFPFLAHVCAKAVGTRAGLGDEAEYVLVLHNQAGPDGAEYQECKNASCEAKTNHTVDENTQIRGELAFCKAFVCLG